jgi:hypothetical protein
MINMSSYVVHEDAFGEGAEDEREARERGYPRAHLQRWTLAVRAEDGSG